MNALEAVEAAIRFVYANEDIADYVGKCSPDWIATAEQEMGLTFPPSYRRFIEEFGTCELGSHGVLGVYEVDGALWGSSGQTLEGREEGMPHHLIAVHEDGMGGIIVLDTSRPGSDGEYPVQAWEPYYEDRDMRETLAPSFGCYVLDDFRQAAADRRETETED
ncbi:SMI1/KNR4 family protein [Streptomyces noursei]|uniref:Knr4/Smi1-like domain-containing protein n=1 Tax=Streptomyces noursei TaxID=1971 RepID=A0A2N8PR62_STRNR|nr:SMI1/KNR4 family protein [Streptomyces noursei]PNE43512.1 hypothetical protein AOB60_00995 [Streptomyces noursei]